MYHSQRNKVQEQERENFSRTRERKCKPISKFKPNSINRGLRLRVLYGMEREKRGYNLKPVKCDFKI